MFQVTGITSRRGIEPGVIPTAHAKIQQLMVDEFGVKARNNDMLGSMSDLAAKLGGSGYAEND